MQGFPFEIRRERKCQSRINCYWLVNIWINIPNVNNERFYVDYGYSGTNFQRPEFQQMIEDCRLGLLVQLLQRICPDWGENICNWDGIWILLPGK